MTSLRHNPEDGYLDAARATILAVGWRRTTLTDVAKRAGVSRMTIYRRWPDMQALLADLLVREWGGLLAGTLGDPASTPTHPGRAEIVDGVVAVVTALRED